MFESEAKIKSTNPNFRNVPVNYLPEICEQALILRSLEIHGNLEDSEECTIDLDLLNTHKCSVSENNLEERRRKLAEVNTNIAVRLKEDLRIQAEMKLKKEEEKKRAEEEKQREIERLAQLEQFKQKKPKKSFHEIAPSVNSISNYNDHENFEEEGEGEGEGEEEEDQEFQSEYTEQIEESHPHITEIDLPENLTVIEEYSDGFSTYFLLQDKAEDLIRGYIVGEISNDSFNPLFILPNSLILKDKNINIELQLSVQF